MTALVNMDYKSDSTPIKCTYGNDSTDEETHTCPNDAMLPLRPDRDDPKTRYEGPLWCMGCQELDAQLRKHMLVDVLAKDLHEIILRQRVLRRWRKYTLKRCFAARAFQALRTVVREVVSEWGLTPNKVVHDYDLKGTSR